MSEIISTTIHDCKLFLHRTGQIYKTGPQGSQVATALDLALLGAARCEDAEVSEHG
jgi:hypothetical protein